MGQHGDHAGSLHARRIVEGCMGEAICLELRHAVLAQCDHVLLGSELQAAGRARFDASRLKAHLDAVDAQRALGHLARVLVELGNVEGTPSGAQAAANALIRVHIDNPVAVLDDRARCRTSGEATWIGAVHALVLTHQPSNTAIVFTFVETNQVPVVRGQGGHRLVSAGLLRVLGLEIVPLLAGDLACLAADAGAGVDVLGNGRQLANSSFASSERRGGTANLEVLRWHRSPPTLSRPSPGTPCTLGKRRSRPSPTASEDSPTARCETDRRRSPSGSRSRSARALSRRL